MRKSTTFGILILFAGYAVASYGYVLIRGWDIPVRSWFDPLHAWSWQQGITPIPQGQVFPGGVTPSQAGGGGGQSSTSGQAGGFLRGLLSSFGF